MDEGLANVLSSPACRCTGLTFCYTSPYNLASLRLCLPVLKTHKQIPQNDENDDNYFAIQLASASQELKFPFN